MTNINSISECKNDIAECKNDTTKCKNDTAEYKMVNLFVRSRPQKT